MKSQSFQNLLTYEGLLQKARSLNPNTVADLKRQVNIWHTDNYRCYRMRIYEPAFFNLIEVKNLN